jgi:hypothetical protein
VRRTSLYQHRHFTGGTCGRPGTGDRGQESKVRVSGSPWRLDTEYNVQNTKLPVLSLSNRHSRYPRETGSSDL